MFYKQLNFFERRNEMENVKKTRYGCLLIFKFVDELCEYSHLFIGRCLIILNYKDV